MLQSVAWLQKNKAFLSIFTVVFILALALGYLGVSQQLIFGWDQARDAYEALAISQGDIKIQGPSSDIPGVHHGVLWYYFLAVPYWISNGDPVFVAQIVVVLTLLTMPLCYLLAHKLFNNRKVAAVSSILYILSPLLLAFSRWLSNPLLAIFITPVLLYSLWSYIKKQTPVTALAIGVLMGLLIQSNFAYGIFLLTVPMYFLYFGLKFRVSDFLAFSGGILLAMSTYLAAEVRFNGKATQSIFAYLRESYGSSSTATQGIITLIDRTVDLLYLTILPLPKLAVFVILLFIMYWIRQKKLTKDSQPLIFLLIWISTLFFFLFFRTGILHSSHIFAPLIIAVAITAGALVAQVKGKMLVVVVGLVLLFQAYKTVDWIQHKSMPLSVQPDINYYDEVQIVDYTYQSANGEPFTITTITNPLDINTTWAYLYEQYGKSKYGYVPYWHGKSQEGYLGNLPEKPFATDLRFLIIEPTEGIQELFVIKAIYDQDLISDIVEEKSFNKFTVQKRRFHPDKPPVATPAAILRSEIYDEYIGR